MRIGDKNVNKNKKSHIYLRMWDFFRTFAPALEGVAVIVMQPSISITIKT